MEDNKIEGPEGPNAERPANEPEGKRHAPYDLPEVETDTRGAARHPLDAPPANPFEAVAAVRAPEDPEGIGNYPLFAAAQAAVRAAAKQALGQSPTLIEAAMGAIGAAGVSSNAPVRVIEASPRTELRSWGRCERCGARLKLHREDGRQPYTVPVHQCRTSHKHDDGEPCSCCSFCGAQPTPGRPTAVSAGVGICGQCIELLGEALQGAGHRDVQGQPRPLRITAVPDGLIDQCRATLAAHVAAARGNVDLDTTIRIIVVEAVSWTWEGCG